MKEDVPTVRLLTISETQLKILETLVGKNFDDEMIKYKIAGETGLDPERVHECIGGRKPGGKRRGFPGLSGFGLLSAKKIGIAPAGQPKKAYALTFEGLVKVLVKRPKLWEKIDEIASRHVEIFPLFARWDYFTRTGIKNLIVRSLKEFFERDPHPLLEAKFTPHGWKKREFPPFRIGRMRYLFPAETWESFRLEATRRALSLYKPGAGMTTVEVKAWVEAISSDPELSKFTLELGESRKRWISATKDASLSFEDDVLIAVKQKNPEHLIRRIKKRKLQRRENLFDRADVLTKELERSFIKHWRSQIKKRGGEKA